MPGLFHEVRATAEGVLPRPELTRLDAAIAAAGTALEAWAADLRSELAGATADWALGNERYDELVRLRAFDDLDADAILAIGEEQLRTNHDARRAALLEIDPDADEPSVIDRLKRDHPATFEEALEGYRDAMRRARAYLVEHDLATVPDDEVIEVIPTPEYLRSVMPFAAYFPPARFDADQRGLYVVTPAVDNAPTAMREHYRASISNTSIHEAYPGHHLQLAVATKHPSLTRMLTDAPEFVEGWGMYSEQMMREQGFDAGPEFRAAMYTDAIWRSCRIILDVRMHRGELTTDEATDFLVEHTSFETANARAEVRRYTYTPGYQLSYLLGKVLILGLREEERRRRGAGFSLRRLPRHAAPQRLAADQLPPPAAPGRGLTRVEVIPAIDVTEGRSRIVYWPGASAGIGSPTDRPDRIAEQLVAQGARMLHLVDFDGARRAAPANLDAVGAVAARVAVPLQVAGGLEEPDHVRLAFAAGATRAVLSLAIVDRPDALRGCVEVAGDWLAVGLDPRPERLAAFPWRRPVPPALLTLVDELSASGVHRIVLAHGGSTPDPELLSLLVRRGDVDVLVAGGAVDLDGVRRLRDAGVAGLILGEPLLTGALDLPRVLEAAA